MSTIVFSSSPAEGASTTPGAVRHITVMVAAVTRAATTAATRAVEKPVLSVMRDLRGVRSVGFRDLESQNVVGPDPVRRAVDEPGFGAFGLLLGKLQLPFIEIGFGRCKLGLRHILLLGADGLRPPVLSCIGRGELAVTHCRVVLPRKRRAQIGYRLVDELFIVG